jgi:hypothetical protein
MTETNRAGHTQAANHGVETGDTSCLFFNSIRVSAAAHLPNETARRGRPDDVSFPEAWSAEDREIWHDGRRGRA